MAQLRRAKIATAEPEPREQPFACVPHADGFVGLLDVPGLRACASLPVRADCRPDIHSCRPLPLPWSAPCAFLGPQGPQKTSEAVKARGPPRPVPRRMTIAARSVSVRDATTILVLWQRSRTKCEQRRTIFLKSRKQIRETGLTFSASDRAAIRRPDHDPDVNRRQGLLSTHDSAEAAFLTGLLF